MRLERRLGDRTHAATLLYGFDAPHASDNTLGHPEESRLGQVAQSPQVGGTQRRRSEYCCSETSQKYRKQSEIWICLLEMVS